MGLHVYCIAPAAHSPPPALHGIGGAPVTVVPVGELAVWASVHDERPAASLDVVEAHNRVITDGMDTTVTPVPVRFGQWFDDEASAAQRVGADAPRWHALLRQFAGHAEYGISVSAGSAEPPARDMHPRPADSGTAYMAQLARRIADARAGRDETDRIAKLCAERIGSLAAATHSEVSRGTLRLANLVAWSDATSYHSAVQALREEQPVLQFVCTGPWPPYTFVQ
jgi:hypothetical protein